MPEVNLSVDVAAPAEQVWAALVDWETQGRWMLLTDVRTEDGDGRVPGAQGVGGRLVARTGVPLPGGRRLGVLDPMLITSWEAPRRVDVRHLGRVVRGTGTFEVVPRGESTSTFVWTESLDLPLGRLGQLGWPLVRPAMVAGVRYSLRRFAAYAAAHPA
ncbi:SRPBCC family protein [Modestobacter lapidis]|nr:SRPBCC family protein [Modestobacter lapidis]